MTPSKWFYVLASTCLVAVSATAVYFLVRSPQLRYERGETVYSMFDRRTGKSCILVDEFSGRCVDWQGRTIEDISFMHVTPIVSPKTAAIAPTGETLEQQVARLAKRPALDGKMDQSNDSLYELYLRETGAPDRRRTQ